MSNLAAGVAGTTASNGMSAVSEARMDALMGTDNAWAIGFVIGLIASYLFVLFQIFEDITRPGITIALGVFGFLVILFNVASTVALISHYKEDKTYIYGLDIRHSDANRAAKAAGRPA